jgi:hypothetical protein
MRVVGLVFALLLIAGLALAEDQLILKDGQVITGKIVSVDRRDVRIRTDDGTRRVPRMVIETIRRSDPEPHPGPSRASNETSVELSAWIDLCVRHLESEDAGVRMGAIAALKMAGLRARPALEHSAANSKESVPSAVPRLLAQLDRTYPDQVPKRPGKAGLPVESSFEDVIATLELDEQQVQAIRAAVMSFEEGVTELKETVRSGEIEPTESDEKFSVLRSDLKRELALTLDEVHVRRCLEMLPSGIPEI